MFDTRNNNLEHLFSTQDLCHQKSCSQKLFLYQHHIDVLTESLANVEFSLKGLEKIGKDLSKEEILCRLNGICNFKEVGNKKIDLGCFDSNFFSQKQSELNTAANSTLSMDGFNKFYQIPVEIQIEKYAQPQIYEVPVELELMVTHQDIQKFLNQIQSWENLSQSLKNAFNRILTTKPEISFSKDNNKLQMSFENEKHQQNNIDNSFSISEVGKKAQTLTVGMQTDDLETISCEIQTDPQLLIQEYRLTQEAQQDSLECWEQIDGSLKTIEALFKNQIHLQTQQQDCLEDKDSSYEHEMNVILEEVDEVLGNIQNLIHEIPKEEFSEYHPITVEGTLRNEEEMDITSKQFVENNRIDEGDFQNEILDQAENAIKNISQLLSGIPQYSYDSRFKAIEMVDQSIQAIMEYQKIPQIYEVPIELEMIDQSEDEAYEQEEGYQQELKEEAWNQVSDAVSNIQRLLGVVSNDKMKQSSLKKMPSSNLQDESNLSAQNEEDSLNYYKEYEEYVDNVNKFRLDKEEQEHLEWEQIDGALVTIQKIFYELPTEIIPAPQSVAYIETSDKEIQTCHLEFEDLGSYESQCKQKKEKIESDWIEIDGALANIQKALYEIPIMMNDELMPQATHESYIIHNYEIPVDMEIESNLSESVQSKTENMITQTIGEIKIMSNQSEQIQCRHEINEYEISNDFQLQRALSAAAKILRIQQNVYQASVCSEVNKNSPVEIGVMANVETMQMGVQTQCFIQTEDEGTQTEFEEREEKCESNKEQQIDSLDKYQENESEQNSIQMQQLQLNFQNLHKTPTKPSHIRAINTSRQDHKNKSYYLEVESSDGNITDRSILLRRNQRMNCFDSLNPSININEEMIAPEKYYELLENNEKLEEKLSLFEEMRKKVQSLEYEKTTQKKFFMTQKVFNDKKVKSLEYELQSYKTIASEMTEKYEQEISKGEELEYNIRELQDKVISLQKVISQKMVTFNDTNDKYEEHLEYLYATIRKLRLDLDESEEQRRCLEADKSKELFNYNEELARKDNIMYYIEKQNEELKHEIEVQRAINEQLKNSMSDLFGRVELALIQNGASENLENIYSGSFNKIKKQLKEKDENLSKLENQNEVLRDKIDLLIQQIQKKNVDLSELQQKVNEMEIESQNSKKITIEPFLEDELEFLRKGYVTANQELMRKDQQIIQLNQALESMKERSVKSLSINFIPGSNQEPDNLTERASYIHELEDIIHEYENIIAYNQKTIKELQDEVYEYLGEALEKEEQLEVLCKEIFPDESEYDNEESLNEVANKFDSALKNYNNRRVIAIQQGICPQVSEYSITEEDGREQDQFFDKISNKKQFQDYSRAQKMHGPKRNQTMQYNKKMMF